MFATTNLCLNDSAKAATVSIKTEEYGMITVAHLNARRPQIAYSIRSMEELEISVVGGAVSVLADLIMVSQGCGDSSCEDETCGAQTECATSCHKPHTPEETVSKRVEDAAKRHDLATKAAPQAAAKAAPQAAAKAAPQATAKAAPHAAAKAVPQAAAKAVPQAEKPQGPAMVSLGSGLAYMVTKTPSKNCPQVTAKAGDKLRVKYSGCLAKTGKVFDKGTFEFRLGRSEVISGWDKGLSGVALGEGRKILIPSVFGYGAKGASPQIPPNADLVFDTEILAIRGLSAK